MGLDNPIHILFIVLLLLLVFGAKRLPEIGRSLGTGMREFKDSVTGSSSDEQPQQPALTQTAQPQPVAPPQPVAQPAQAAQPVAPAQPPVAPAESATSNPFGA